MDAPARKPSLGAIFLTICLDLLGFGLALPFLADVARTTFHVSSFVGTLLASSYSLMQFLFVPMWGRISDRVGRKPVLAWSIAMTAIANLALGLSLAFAHNVAWVFAARMFAGLATANLGTATAYIADITSPKDRAKGMGLVGMAFGVGFILGPAFGGLLAQITLNDRHGPYALFAAAGLSVVNFVWVVLGLVESLPEALEAKRSGLSFLRGFGGEAPITSARKKSTRKLTPLDFTSIGHVLTDRSIARAVLANFVLILFFSGMEQTFRFFNADAFHMTLGETGAIFAMVGVTAALVQGGLVRRLSGKIEDARMLRIGLLLQAIAFAGITTSTSTGRGFLYASSVLLAFGNGLTQPAVSAFVSKHAHAGEQGATLGVLQSFSSLARMFGPALAGFVYDSVLGIHAPFTLACIGVIVALLIALPLRDRAADPVTAL